MPSIALADAKETMAARRNEIRRDYPDIASQIFREAAKMGGEVKPAISLIFDDTMLAAYKAAASLASV